MILRLVNIAPPRFIPQERGMILTIPDMYHNPTQIEDAQAAKIRFRETVLLFEVGRNETKNCVYNFISMWLS